VEVLRERVDVMSDGAAGCIYTPALLSQLIVLLLTWMID
jgi:hypothetical protein